MKLSRRVSDLSSSPTMLVMEEAARMRAEGREIVDFSVGEPDFPTPNNIKRAGHEAIDTNFTRYTGAAGIKELRAAVARRYQVLYGVDYTAEEVVISCGAKHSLFNIVFTLFEEGDEVLLPVPYWVTFPEQLKMVGALPVEVLTTQADGFIIRAEALREKLSPQTRGIILNTPNNPSGAVIPAAELAKIVDLAVEKELYLIFDECYDQFVYEGYRHTSLAEFAGHARDLSILVNTASKTYAMTGWRIGYLVAPRPIARAITSAQSHSANAASPCQKAALESILGPQESVGIMIAEYERRRKYVIERLNSMEGLRCTPPAGAFYAFPDISSFLRQGRGKDSLEFSRRLLQEAGVAVVPGSAFGLEGHIRISFATSLANLEKGLDRMETALANF